MLRENDIEHYISGDGGSFCGSGFEGRFQIVVGAVEIEVSKKPMLIPWAMVESSLTSYFK